MTLWLTVEELVRRHVDLIYSAALRMAGGTQKLLATVSYL